MAVTSKIFHQYWRNETGVFALNFAILSILLLTATSVAITVNDLVRTENRLQLVADSAVLAATAVVDIPVEERQRLGNAAFDANIGALESKIANKKLTVSGQLPTPNKPNTIVTANIELSVEVESLFAFAIPKLAKVSVSSEAIASYSAATDTPFIDIYMVVDNSASMGIGQTIADRDAMVYDKKITKDMGMESCAFACHSPGQDSYTYYSNKGIRLRIDAVSDALTRFVDQAVAEIKASAENTRISIIPLDQVKKLSAYNFSPTLEAAQTRARNVELTKSSGYTDLQTPLNTINGLITNVGDGSSASSPLVYVVVMTDGLEHFEDPSITGEALPALSPTSSVDPTIDDTFIQTLEDRHCKPLKKRGVNLLIMNVEYGFPDLIWDWPVKNWQNIGYKPDLDQLILVDSLLPQIPTTLRNCASTHKDYYQVESEKEMNKAFDLIFGDIILGGKDQIYTRIVR